MGFAAPIWLLGLLPWAAVTLWLLSGRRRRQVVPFLPLWPEEATQAKPRRALRVPPVALAAAMLAVLFAVLAAGGPKASGGGLKMTVAIIVDRGMTMSARGPAGRRYAELAAAVQPRVRAVLGAGPVRLVSVPGDSEQTTRDQWADVAASLPPTAVDTAAALASTITARLRDSDGPILVLTDQPVEIDDARLVLVRPASMPRNVGIVSLAARETPSPEVMVRLRNSGGKTNVRLEVGSGDHRAERGLDLPAGGEVNVFLGLPGAPLNDVVEAHLRVDDDLDADNRAWLVRGHERPRLEPRSSLPEALRRMIAVYQRGRPGGERSASIAVVAAPAELRGLEPGVVFSPPAGEPAASTRSARDPDVVADPVTAYLDWPAVVRDASIAPVPPPGWMPLVTLGDRVLVARRSEPVRQVWVGFDSPGWPRTADYVLFWANVFDWVGGGSAEEFVSEAVQPLGPEWTDEDGHVPAGTPAGLWPGLYRRPDGARRAINAPAVQLPGAGEENWEKQLASVAARSDKGGTPLAPPLLLAAAICGVVAMGTWKRRSTEGKGAERRFASAG